MEKTASGYLWYMIILATLSAFSRWALTRQDFTFFRSLSIFFGGVALGIVVALLCEENLNATKTKILVGIVAFGAKEVGEFIVEYLPKKLKKIYDKLNS